MRLAGDAAHGALTDLGGDNERERWTPSRSWSPPAVATEAVAYPLIAVRPVIVAEVVSMEEAATIIGMSMAVGAAIPATEATARTGATKGGIADRAPTNGYLILETYALAK